jgi:hypothetical protein
VDPVQQPLFPEGKPEGSPFAHPASPDRTGEPAGLSGRVLNDENELHVTAAPVWLQRASLLLLVLFCLYIGVIVVFLPWSTRLWDQNPWILAHPTLADLLHQGWLRGCISGFGLLDIWIGVSEVMHYRDHRA